MEPADPGNLDAKMVIMKRRLLALAWMMPPLIFPRSLQIARTLSALVDRHWITSVIAVPPEVEPYAALDPRLAEFYSGLYGLIFVDPREEVVPSALWLRLIRKALGVKPTNNSNWMRRAANAATQQIITTAPEAFVSFAQPWINHLVALQVKRRHPRLPWIAHFSDPWVDSPYFRPESNADRNKAIKNEAAIIAEADIVIFTTKETADLVMAKYPGAWQSKVRVVSHGFDAALLGLVNGSQKSDKFTIIHTGNLYEHREPMAFLEALSLMRKEMPDMPLQVNFVGYASQALHDRVAELELEDFVTLSAAVPYIESLAIARTADLLLVIDAPSDKSVFLPSKIPDYLVLRQPLLALTPIQGASARALGRMGFPIVDPTDEAGILSCLKQTFSRWQHGESATTVPSDEAIRCFDIREVVQDFEEAIENAIALKVGRRD